MAKAARELEQEFVAGITDITGHTLDDWMTMIEVTGLQKNNEILKWVKSEHHLNHMQASMLAGIYLNDGKLVHDYANLLTKLFAGKEIQRPLYEAIEALVLGNFADAQAIPTKTYVSFEAERGFATAKINKKDVRVGLDLGDEPFTDYIQQAKSLGAMPRYSHMVVVQEKAGVNADLLRYLQQSYERVQ